VSQEVYKKKDVAWWLSIYYLFAGLIYITISIIIIALLNTNVQVLLDLLTFILLMLGISRLLYGVFSKDSAVALRILKTIIGVAVIVLSGFDFYIREPTNFSKITLLAVGILLVSALRISVGILDKSETKWFRIMLVVIGSITFIISILFLIFPEWDINVYVILLAVSFILQGLAKLNSAIKVFEKK